MKVKYASERKDGESRPEHIERVVQQFAGPAFWQEVAKAFPQVRTGDFGPEESARIDHAMTSAVATWLKWNEPAPTHDQLSAAGQVLQDGALGDHGTMQDLTAKLVGPELAIPSPAQADCDVEPDDFLVIIGSTESTSVMIIGREGELKASYEVQ